MTPPDAPKNILARVWDRARANPIVAVLAALLVILLAGFGFVAFDDQPEWAFRLFGVGDKIRTLELLGVGIGGVMFAVFSYMRTQAMDKTARAQARASEAQADAARQQAEANRNAEKGLRQERLKNAIEHLGGESPAIRMGGAYELFHLAEDTEEWRRTIFDILCAHIRRTTGEVEYREKRKSEPSEEIQSLLTLLFVQEHEVFKGLRANLRGSWLKGADLRNALFQGADLREARLQGASLMVARLQGADLRWAQLQGADLLGGRLQRANLRWAYLQGMSLYGAHLQGASLFGAHLQGASLKGARLQGADISGAQVQGAELCNACLQGAQLENAQLQGVVSHRADIGLRFEQYMRERSGQPSDLSGVDFAGGLTREYVDDLVADLSSGVVSYFWVLLEPHIDKPVSHELPRNSLAVTGTYSKEQAEGWIAEYEAAMAEVPPKDAG